MSLSSASTNSLSSVSCKKRSQELLTALTSRERLSAALRGERYPYLLVFVFFLFLFHVGLALASFVLLLQSFVEGVDGEVVNVPVLKRKMFCEVLRGNSQRCWGRLRPASSQAQLEVPPFLILKHELHRKDNFLF